MEERVRSEILGQMEEILSAEQLSILGDVLAKVLRVYKVERANELVVYDRSNDKLLNLFIASLRLEGKAESTLFQYRLAVTDMLGCVGKRIPNVTTNDIRFYLAEYQRKGVSKLTVDNRRRCLSSFFAWLTVEEYIVKNPMLRFKKIKADKKVKKAFSDSDIEKLRTNCKTKRERALIEFLLSTGCRVSEVVNLDLNSVDLVSREAVVFGKGSKERKVYISDRALFYLLTYLDGRDAGPVFLARGKKRISKQSIEKMLHNLGERSCVDNVHPHRFRRTFATNALNKGMPVQHVQRILGHQSLDTTMIYCEVNEDLVKSEHRKIA